MKRSLRSLMTVFIGLCVVMLVFTGCSTAGRYSMQNPNQGTQGSTLQGRNLIGGNMQGNTGTNPGTGTRFGIRTSPGTGINPGGNRVNQNITQPVVFDKKKADNVKAQLAKMPGLQNVNVVVSGNTVLVGYASTGTVKDKEAKKTTVTSKVKQIDKSLTNVLIGDSSEISAQIGRLSNDITGSNVSGDLGSRFNQLVQSLRPR